MTASGFNAWAMIEGRAKELADPIGIRDGTEFVRLSWSETKDDVLLVAYFVGTTLGRSIQHLKPQKLYDYANDAQSREALDGDIRLLLETASALAKGNLPPRVPFPPGSGRR